MSSNISVTPRNTQPADFSQHQYQKLLAETRRLYSCVGFEVLDEPSMVNGRYCIIRHDIDMSPHTAREIAAIENNLGVRATYTVLLSGKFYSPFEADTRDTIREIAALGHDIGLHFDAAWHNIDDEASLSKAIAWELAILEGVLPGIPIRMFSFHNTTPFTMNCKASHYGSLRNAYAGVLQEKVAYVSDSNGYWRFKTWAQRLAEHPDRLQVLTHPEWWTELNSGPAEKVCWHIDQRARTTWDYYVDMLVGLGRENRSMVPAALATLSQGNVEEREILRMWLSGHRHLAYRRLLLLAETTGGALITPEMRAVDLSAIEDRLPHYFDRLAQLRST